MKSILDFKTIPDYYKYLRGYYAGLAMQGIMANPHTMPTTDEHFNNIIDDAVRVANELIKRLDK